MYKSRYKKTVRAHEMCTGKGTGNNPNVMARINKSIMNIGIVGF